MGKIYCFECGKELDDSMKFCPYCGVQLDIYDNFTGSNEVLTTKNTSNEEVKDNEHSNKIVHNNPANDDTVKTSTPSKKFNFDDYSTFTKIFLGIAGICIIIFIVGVVIFGFTMMNSTGDVDGSGNTLENLSPSFTDTIDGISFKIPEGYNTIDGIDNQNHYTYTVSDRYYETTNGSMITISVSTSQGNFYWDLSQSRSYNAVDKTINGHEGVLDGDSFKYITDGKLVMINGASEDQLESIIVE